MVSLMLETKAGSGEYKASTDSKWPTSGYEFNESLSNCENGGKLTWNKDKGTVTVKTNKSDRCYVYFDVVPHDVNLTIKIDQQHMVNQVVLIVQEVVQHIINNTIELKYLHLMVNIHLVV